MAEQDITAERVRELLNYDPSTGIFTHAMRRAGVRFGLVAGTINADRYRIIQLDGVGYFAHNLAWLYVKGSWPHPELDHRNRMPDDNRFENLREATHAQNMCNREMPVNNRSGFVGVGFHIRSGKWRACIGISGKAKHLGLFATPELAKNAYAEAARKHHAEFSGSGD